MMMSWIFEMVSFVVPTPYNRKQNVLSALLNK